MIDGRVEMGYYINDEDKRVTLRFIDHTSGIIITEAELSPLQFRDILAGTSTNVKINMCPKPYLIGRKVLVRKTVGFDHEPTTVDIYSTETRLEEENDEPVVWTHSEPRISHRRDEWTVTYLGWGETQNGESS